jgi:hypothetical protein
MSNTDARMVSEIMGQGVSHNVYMANASGQENYVMAAINADWALADFIVEAAMPILLAGVSEIAAVAEAAEIPAGLATLSDLFGYLKVAVQFISKTSSTSRHTVDAALALVNAFKNTSIPIAFEDYKNVEREDFLSLYLTPDGIAGVLGAKTVSVMVLSADGKQLAMWNTGSDDSWITTEQQTIVRSKYGSIWQQDPGSGTEGWSDLFSA